MSIVSVFLQRNYKHVVCRVGDGSLGWGGKAEEKADHVIHYDPPTRCMSLITSTGLESESDRTEVATGYCAVWIVLPAVVYLANMF